MSRTQNSFQNSFWTPPWPKKMPIWAPKSQNDPQFKAKSKIRTEGNIENKNFSATWVEPKTVF